jgi:hypothetical protein
LWAPYFISREPILAASFFGHLYRLTEKEELLDEVADRSKSYAGYFSPASGNPLMLSLAGSDRCQ